MNAKFSYHVAASFIVKGRPYNPDTHLFQFNPYNRIQPKKRPKRLRYDSGHDAFFVSRVGESGAVAFGVADGVGGWVESNVDPADFSHAFCDYMAIEAYQHGVDPNARSKEDDAPLTARRLMHKGYMDVIEDGTIRAGGSTACVGVASPDGTLDVANLGDSGYIILRLNGVHSYSEPQTHAFNTPFQLSVIPSLMAKRMAAFGGRGFADMPADSDVTNQQLQHGDVVVFASDGVWDNLFNQDILEIVSQVMRASGAWQVAEDGGIKTAEELVQLTALPEAVVSQQEDRADAGRTKPPTLQGALATVITGTAKQTSMNKESDGPFAKAAQKAYPGENWHGGKVDDICVVVVVVTKEQPIMAKL